MPIPESLVWFIAEPRFRMDKGPLAARARLPFQTRWRRQKPRRVLTVAKPPKTSFVLLVLSQFCSFSVSLSCVLFTFSSLASISGSWPLASGSLVCCACFKRVLSNFYVYCMFFLLVDLLRTNQSFFIEQWEMEERKWIKSVKQVEWKYGKRE